jgi:tetratricopeptide (TPR) repeat protein
MRHPHVLVLFLLCVVLLIRVAAQPSRQDSLVTAIRALPADSNRAAQLADLAYSLIRKAPSDALRYAEEALGLSETENYHTGEVRAHYVIGVISVRTGQMDEALSNYSRALQLCNRYGLKAPKADVLRGMGNLFLDQGDLEMAEGYFGQSIAQARELGDSLGVGKSLNNLGSIAAQRADRPLAIQHFSRAAALFVAANEAVLLATSYSNLSGQYAKMGQYDQAIAFCNQAMEVSQQLNDKRSQCAIYERLQMISRDQQQVDEAIRYGYLGLELARQVDNGVLLCNMLRSASLSLLQKGDNKAAVPLMEEAIAIYKNIENASMLSQTTYDLAGILVLIPDLPRALRTANDALNLARLQEEFALMAACENLVGEILVAQKDDKQALERFLRATTLINQHHLPQADFVAVYQNLVALYGRTGQPGKAQEMQIIYNKLNKQ